MLKNILNFKNKYVIYGILILISLFICFQSPLNIISKTSSATDSSVFRYIALEMKNGNVPYLNTFDHKGLLTYILNYIGTMISYNHGVWLLEIIFMYGTIYFSYKTANLFSNNIASILVVFFCYSSLSQLFQGGNLTEEWALPFICLSLYIFSKYYKNKNVSRLEVVVCGICFAAVSMLRVNMVILWISFAIGIFTYLYKRKEYKYILKYLFEFILGVSICLIPMVLYLLKNNALFNFVEDYIIFNIKYQNTDLIYKFETLLFFLSRKEVLIIIALYLYMYLDRYYKVDVNYFYTSIITTIFSFVVVSMSGRDYAHYGMILLPTYIFPVAVIFNKCVENINSTEKNLSNISRIIILFFVIFIAGSNWMEIFKNSINVAIKNNAYDEFIVKIISDNTIYNDKITIEGNCDKYYVLTNRLSASKYSYQDPIASVDSNINITYINDLEKNIPKVVLTLKDQKKSNEQLKNFVEKYNYKNIYEDQNYVIYKYR